MIANPNITATQTVKPADGETLLWACDQRDARTLGPGLLNDARNLRFSDGLPTTRKGVIKPAWANLTNASNFTIASLGTPHGAGVFRDPNGVEWQVIAAGGLVYRTRPGNGNVFIPLPAGVAVVSTCRFVQAFNLLFLFRGRYLAPLVLADLDTGFADLLPQYDPTVTYDAAVVATGQAADEMAYGPFQAVASLTWAANVATCATVTPHGYVTGADVTIKGAQPTQFNGRVNITVVDNYTFTYALLNNATATATGTILVSNNAWYWLAAGSGVTLASLTQVTSSFAITSLTCPAAFAITTLTCPNSFEIQSLTHSVDTATATAANHGLVTGELVTIVGAKYNYYNSAYNTGGNPFPVTVINANQFTYLMQGTPAGNDTTGDATGTALYGQTALAVATKHGLTSGETVTVAGATPAAYNGTFAVTVVNANEFTYAMASNPSANGSGSITATPAGYLTATAVAPGNGLASGDSVTISGATPGGYNGTYAVTVVTPNSTFTYTLAGAVTSPATGNLLGTIAAGGGTGALGTSLTPHGFVTGDYVTISGATQAAYDGTFSITVLSPTTFTYTLASAPQPGGPATGTVRAQTSRVYAGQTPDSNPDAWTREYDVLPNAETALFTQNLLLVPTAFAPQSADNYATINGGEYATVDYLVATNYLDYLHFEFNNEFRINQGTADEIVDLFVFGQAGNVVVLKGKSYWLITGLASGSISAVSAQCMSTEFGAAGPRSWSVVGANAYFLSPTYGVVVIRTTDLGTILSVNVPLSAPIQPTMDQIDWTQGTSCRMSHWDNKLYLALPLKNGTRVLAVYDFKSSVRMGNNVWESGVMTQGWTPVDTGPALAVVEFFRLTLLGAERHFFLDTAGYVNLLEEADPALGDQVAGSGPQGLAWTPIDSYGLSRAYGTSVDGQQRPVEVCVSVATRQPTYSVSVVLADAFNSLALVTNKTRSNTAYVKPFTRAPWDPSNVNLDWATPFRQDYGVSLDEPYGANLVPTNTLYIMGMATLGLTPGRIYYWTPGPNGTQLTAGSQMLTSAGWFTGPVSGPVTLYGAGQYVQDAVQTAGFFPAGVALDQYQETLDTRRVSGKQGKSFQVEFENTTGALKLVGIRISQVPGRNRRGILT